MAEFTGRRAIVIVLDGCGAGEAPDAAAFGDLDHPATVRHVWEKCGPLKTHNLARCGFLRGCGIPVGTPETAYGRLRELSMGKDSVTGHWEMMGIHTKAAFPTYPGGFPEYLIARFESAIGRSVLGNKPASGTAIIDELGAEHLATGRPIVYTSADSVFQIACHEDVVPLDQLYEFCVEARALCVSPNNLQRIIARPFVGSPGHFVRTGGRRDFPAEPPPNLVDEVGDVSGIGVTPELFNHRGFRPTARTSCNAEHAEAVWVALQSDARFVFANFEDFDMRFGHRNDPEGFAGALEEFDVFLGRLLNRLLPGDLLILTADHGNDPTSVSTDHSREYVPVCVIGPGVAPGSFGDRDGMWAVGATVADHLGVSFSMPEASLLRRL
jgi:phosphopentomutase